MLFRCRAAWDQKVTGTSRFEVERFDGKLDARNYAVIAVIFGTLNRYGEFAPALNK